jgi:hypothetical protein
MPLPETKKQASMYTGSPKWLAGEFIFDPHKRAGRIFLQSDHIFVMISAGIDSYVAVIKQSLWLKLQEQYKI